MGTIPRNASQLGSNSTAADFKKLITDKASLTIKILDLIENECDQFNPISIMGALEELYAQSLLENEVPLEIALESMKTIYKKIRDKREEV